MSTFALTIALIAHAIGLFYAYLVWNFGYWKKRGVKEVKSYPFVGSFSSMFTLQRNLADEIDDFYKQYKNDENFVGVYNTRVPQLLVLDPECAHKIYLNDFKHFHDNDIDAADVETDPVFGNNPFMAKGAAWKVGRAEITPGLTISRVKSVYPVTQEVCRAFTDYISVQSKMAPKDGLNTKELCLRFVTEVVSDCVLGIKAGSLTDRPTPIYETIKNVFESSNFFWFYSVMTRMLPVLRKFYVARFFSKQAEEFFFGLMRTSITLRQQSKSSERADFLQYILQLQDKKQLNIAELTSHTLVFLTDGYETPAAVLSHTLLLLARYPEIQEKLRKEIESQDEINFETLSELPYMEACIHEAIRLFSPLLLGRKICSAPYEFINKNGSKVRVEVGQVVIIPFHSMHRDPSIFENPEEYVPERFLKENGGVKKYRDMGVYAGFGDGPRVCVGMRFAMTQMKSALVEIIKQFNVKVNPRTRKDNSIDENNYMTLLKGGIWLDFEPRL